MTGEFKESDLYEPISSYLKDLGYTVRGEVNDCDLAAMRGDEIVVVELKKAFNLKLLYQCMDRQSITDMVYVGIPRPIDRQNSSSWKNMLRLLKKLEIGLFTVALDSDIRTVDVLLIPGDGKKYKNKGKMKKLKTEIDGRAFDLNTGGINKTKILTAYKEKAVFINCIIEKEGIITGKRLKELGYDDKMISIIRSNYFKWYEKVDRGAYALSDLGNEAMNDKELISVIKFYREKAKKGC